MWPYPLCITLPLQERLLIRVAAVISVRIRVYNVNEDETGEVLIFIAILPVVSLYDGKEVSRRCYRD